MNKICANCSTAYSQFHTLQKCEHIFCEKCLYNHVNEMQGYKIKCPLRYCNAMLCDREIRKFLPTCRIEEYEMSQLPIGIIRKCITKNCLFIYMSENDVIFQCEYCEQPNCTKCKMRHNLNECLNNENHEEIREKAAQETISQRKRKEIESFDLNSDLIPNFDGFVCSVCGDFFLPNTQIMLRTCQHEFCVECLENSLKVKKSFDQLSCPIVLCDTLLTSVEIHKLVGMKFVDSLNKSVIQPKIYKCKYPYCDGFWDYDSQKKGDYECPVCRNKNCISCGVVHKKGETCSKYKSTKEYQSIISTEKNLKSRSKTCHCGKILVYGGGCGALYCDNCCKQICLFTGKLAGQSLPEGCGCTEIKTCHDDCIYGCFPEYK